MELAKACNAAKGPRKRSLSTGPETPGTVPEKVYCQRVALAHGGGALTHAAVAPDAPGTHDRKSGYAASPVTSTAFDEK